MKNVYEKCPIYETESFILRLVELDDAQALLACYSDMANVSMMNSDYCTSDFYYTTVEQMEECIAFWLKEYHAGYYVRFALIPKSTGKPIGTVEIFGGEFGVLRIDIPCKFNKEKNILELAKLTINTFVEDFGIDSIKIKTSNTPERIPWLEGIGFIPSKAFRPDLGYHEYDVKKTD